VSILTDNTQLLKRILRAAGL